MDLINKSFDFIQDVAQKRIARAAEKGATSAISEAVIGTTEKIGENISKPVARKAAKNGSHAAESALAFMDEELEQDAKEGAKKVSSGIGKNAFAGAAVGSITGAGIGGITGVATGADEDNMKSMVVLGALGGATAGGIVGGMSKALTNKGLLDVAGDMAKNGGKNLPAGGGANGVLHKAKAGVQNFGNKLDDFGESISNKISKDAKKTQTDLIKDIKRSNPSMTTSEILNDLRNSEGIYNSIYKENVENISKAVHKGNTIGGAVQGAIMGSATGALIGGVGGAIDEDETFIGGALKGGFIGGALGGAGGAVSGYFNNNARLLANTTSNVNSLFK